MLEKDDVHISDVVARLGKNAPQMRLRHAIVLWWFQMPKEKRSIAEVENMAREYLSRILNEMPAHLQSDESLYEWMQSE
jgi:hypothetical protein